MTGLTDRQREVALLIARGRTHQEAATEIGVSVDTVRFHLDAVKRKLGVEGSRDVATALVAQGIATAEEILSPGVAP